MLTIEKLKTLGADTDTGLERCMGSEMLYLRLASMLKDEKSFGKLRDTLEAGDLDGAFEAAHSLKGVIGNLAFTHMFEVASSLTEHLRAREEMDYTPYLEEILQFRQSLEELCD